MLFIQRLASVVCLILLILQQGTAAPTCQEAFVSFFRQLHKDWDKLDSGSIFLHQLKYLLLPDADSVNILASLKGNPNLGSATIRGHVEFKPYGFFFRSFEFTIYHPNGRSGIVRAVCQNYVCDQFMNDLEFRRDKTNKHILPCLEQKPGEYLMRPTKRNNGIMVELQRFVTLEIFNAEVIFRQFIRLQQTKNKFWVGTETATEGVISRMVTFRDKDEKVIAQVPMPEETSTLEGEYTEVGLMVLKEFKDGMTFIKDRPTDPHFATIKVHR